MSWLALLLVGIGVADLGHSVRSVRVVPECVGAAVVIVLGLLAGLTAVRDVAALVVIAAVVVAWGQTVRQGLGRHREWLPLAVLGGALLAAVLFAPAAGQAGGAVADWLHDAPWTHLNALDPDRALLILGGLLVQCSTGNVVVRLVLAATGTVNPARGPSHDATTRLKGGRLLGPMERLVIFGLGLAGQATAASLVIAAKGLVRWPELQSFRQASATGAAPSSEPSINEVTEYFLVGSFVSWMVALASLVAVAT